MATLSKTRQKIQVKGNEGIIAEIRPTAAGFETTIFVQSYEQALKRIVASLKDSELQVWVASREEVKDGKRFIYDRVRYCKASDSEFVYALAHELGNYRIHGAPIVGRVVPDP